MRLVPIARRPHRLVFQENGEESSCSRHATDPGSFVGSEAAPHLAVWQGDIGIPLSTFIRWAEGHGVRFLEEGKVRIPQLAPGYYTVCFGTPAVVDPRDIEEWKKSRANCASGYLAAASTLDLRLR